MTGDRAAAGTPAGGAAAERTLDERTTLQSEPITPGMKIGRFIVVERLGEGGMGVVLAAYDPVLDRKVAVKLLRVDRQGEDAEAGRERLLREARAMARLDHANVLAVHDVGTLGERVFLAMEFAGGGTLGRWVRERPRNWPEILEKYRSAGRGLAAAHEQGLVHRDFKPENVLLSRDGQVRVADFGLVGRNLEETPDPLAATASSLASPAAPPTITRTGALLGSPAYMAPEQHRGLKAGPAADQFAFCVSLWEALHGKRPFAGESREELAASVIAGRVPEPSEGATVPAWVTAALRRGLQPDPALRWPSMDALLLALESDPDEAARRRRRRVASAGAAAGVALLLAGGGLVLYGDRADPCPDPRPQIASVWNDGEREQLRKAFGATGAVLANFALQKTGEMLDDFASRWVASSSLACREARVLRLRPPEVYEQQQRCFLRSVSALRQTLASLKAADAAAVGRAQQAALALPDLRACAQPRAASAEPLPADAETTRQRIEVQDQVDRLRSDYMLGMNAGIRAAGSAVAARAASLGLLSAQAEALYYLGVARGNVDRWEGIATLAEAVRVAEVASADAIRVRALLSLALRTSTGRDAGPREVQHYVGWAEALIQRMSRAGQRVDDLLAELHNLRSFHQWQAGDYAAALETARLALRHLAIAPDAWAEGQTRQRIAQSLLFLGRPGEALEEARAGSRFMDEIAPAHHRKVTFGWVAAAALNALGRSAEAETEARNALALLHRIFGEKGPLQYYPLRELAEAVAPRDAAEAARLARLAIENTRGEAEANEPYVASTLGTILLESGDARGAIAVFARAFEVARRIRWEDHTDTAEVHACMGLAQETLGNRAEAERQFRRALAIFEPKFGPQHPSLIRALSGLGRVRLAAGAKDEARSLLERALAIPARPVDAPHAARAQLALAELAWSRGEAESAVKLAGQARDRLLSWGRDRTALSRAEKLLAGWRPR